MDFWLLEEMDLVCKRQMICFFRGKWTNCLSIFFKRYFVVNQITRILLHMFVRDKGDVILPLNVTD